MTTVKKTIGRSLPNGDYLEITAELREDDPRGLSDAFSVTCTGWEKRGTWTGRTAKRNGREATYGGCCHEEILKAAPKLAPLVAVHLADPIGVPMHAEASGWYFYSGKSREYEDRTYGPAYAQRLGTDHERAARALHIHPANLPADLDRDGFHAFCESLQETWKAQADTAKEVLAAIVDGDGIELER